MNFQLPILYLKGFAMYKEFNDLMSAQKIYSQLQEEANQTCTTIKDRVVA